MPDPDPASPAFIKMGDFASRSKDERVECGMTPFYGPRSIFYESNSGVCLEVKTKLSFMASVLLHAVAKMVVGLPKALSASAFKPPSGAR